MWTVKGTCLLGDGSLPRNSIWAEAYHRVFFEAKPEIDYAFKVDRPPYIFVWWFDEYLGLTLDLQFRTKPQLGRYYRLDILNSDAARAIGHYIESLGYQVRLALMSIERLEYATIVIFSAEGAILQDAIESRLKILQYNEPWNDDLAEPPCWFPSKDPLREPATTGLKGNLQAWTPFVRLRS